MSHPRTPTDAARPRLAPLARLPIFLDLAGKRAVVAGGGEAAVWKAELLAAAGAIVHVFAPEPSADLPSLPNLEVHRRSLTPADLVGAAVLIVEAHDDTQAARLAGEARAAGVPVNVIDRTDHCDFTFGAIVNRSPVVIGISTDGAAPVLGQAIRRRIETLLPAGLAAWAAFGKELRAALARAVPDKGARRAAWERFAELAMTARGALPDGPALIRRLSQAAPPTGRVSLVGAGPGDAELLTLQAVRTLQSADVILFDDLVGDEVLDLARREAKRMLVGKRGGRSSCRQDDINALMLHLARQGKHVVRLKSGDPMIFGRAGEEIAHLRAAGIPVTVVPGVTAGIAAAARLGVSLTHRDHAQSVRFLTAHSKSGGLPADLDWRGLADPNTTLLVYMGGRTAAALAVRLMHEGLDPRTPVRVLFALSRPTERLVATTLRGLGDADVTVAGEDPVLICIGTVFGPSAAAIGHAEEMQWQCTA